MPRFFVDIEARFAQVTDAINKVNSQVAGAAARMDAAFSGLRATLGGLGAGLAGAFSVAGIASALRDVVAYRSALDDLADTTGGNVRQLDALAREASVSGVAFEQLQGTLAKFARNLSAADDEGHAAARAIQALGLNVERIRASSPDQAFIEVAKALDKFEDGANKVSVAVALLGREGAAMLPFLKDIAEAGEINGRVTAEQAREAEKLEKEWRRLKLAGSDMGAVIADLIVPALADTVEHMNKAIKLSGSLSGALKYFGQNILSGVAIRGPEAVIKELTTEIDKLTEASKKYKDRGDLGLAAETERIIKAKEAYREYLQVLSGQTLRRQGQDPQSQLFEFGGGGIKAQLPELPDVNAELNFLKELEDARRDAESESREIGQLIAKMDKEAIFRAEKAVELEEMALQDRTEAWEAYTKIRVENEAKIKAAQQEGLKALFETIDLEQEQAIEKGQELLDAEAEAIRRNKDLVSDLGFTFQSAFEDAVIAGNEFRDVLKGISQDIARIILRRTVTEPLAAGVSEFVGGLFAPRAAGGPVNAGRAFLVGEEGPELFVPRQSGTIVPNGAAGGVTIANGDINITGSGVTMPQVVQALELQHRRTIAAVRELQRR